ncbi:MAG: AMP-binding protein [Phycisphaerales bacterium]
MRNDLHAYAHSVNDHPLVGMTIDEYFKGVVETFPDNEAIVSIPQGRRLTYRALDAGVQEVAKGLLALGVAPGDRVGVWATDHIEWVLLQMATARVGAVLVNINPAYRLAELRHAMRLARVSVLVLIPGFRSSDYVGMIAELVDDTDVDPQDLRAELLPALRRVVVFDPMDLARTERWHNAFHTWHEFIAAGRAIPDANITMRSASIDPDDAVNIQFTSGTTGFPKGVTLTHHNILNNGRCVGRAMSFTEHDRLCVPLPFYHCFGMVVSNLACLTHGACIVIPSDHFDAGVTLKAIQDERCTAVHGVPTMFNAELAHPDFDSFDLSSLRTGIMAGAPCPPELMRRVMHDMGCEEILIGYGQTECSPIATMTKALDTLEHRTETVGLPFPHQEVKVVDPETGRTVPRGVPGEICFRGYHVMLGYDGQPEETARAIDEHRWLHSGDLGIMREDGYIAITGRLKDMIIRGGENIYPAEIEAFYAEHPDISEIAVFGVPDEKLGERVGAWVRPHDARTLDSETLRTYAKGQIAHYKVPTDWWFVADFPMTVTGKIQKNRIRDAVTRWIEAGGAASGSHVESFVR